MQSRRLSTNYTEHKRNPTLMDVCQNRRRVLVSHQHELLPRTWRGAKTESVSGQKQSFLKPFLFQKIITPHRKTRIISQKIVIHTYIEIMLKSSENHMYAMSIIFTLHK